MSVYQHFRVEERPFIDTVLDWKEGVLTRYQPKCSDFLDPRQQDIIRHLLPNHDDVQLIFNGGYEQAERKRAILLPPYFSLGENDFNIVLFEIHYPKKFAQLSHPELLGALTGLGLVRDKFGDLLFHHDRVQFLAAKEIADFVQMNLTSVGRVKVSCDMIALSELVHTAEEWEESDGTVSSLRLDAVLSEIYRLPRSKAAAYIENGAVKVNWKRIEKPAYDLLAGDHLSLRGHGRSKVNGIYGTTKKGKQRIKYSHLK
ncbi:RNA-binding protein YlmH [Scopulibacillus darangshiensis]|uniref:RNA-binding protein YlmH n=1 Tax=Scopulibacillus darangshiensis TaxID=442528 RepID=A0A4R2P3D8_9BACL|nr:RNA-binding protein [Scopulibacillus darangshiensis]TCP29107.1 RNA-binding protein YlmH [Scopulibacillus darangshiensis]